MDSILLDPAIQLPQLPAHGFELVLALDPTAVGFDVLDITFSNGEKTLTLGVAMSPMDISADGGQTLFPNSDEHAAWWAYVILVVGEVLILWLLQILLHKLCGLPNWVMIILVAVTVVLDIFFIQSWAVWLTGLLEPYLGWLPFS